MSTSPSALKAQIQQLIRETIAEHQIVQNQTPNEQGQIISINDDGTVNVMSTSGVYSNCAPGPSKNRVIGDAVVLLTADGQKVAI